MIISREQQVALNMQEAALRIAGKKSRNYLGMSGIGKACSRALWLTFRGYPSEQLEGRIAMIFQLGDAIEEIVISYLKTAGYFVSDTQTAFSDYNGYFTGHCDGIITGISSKPHILEIKSANNNRFKQFQLRGVANVSPEYYCQVQCYMGYASLDRALLIVMNKDTSELYIERIYFNMEDFLSLKARAYQIINSHKSPDKIDDKKTCHWCAYKLICDDSSPCGVNKACRTCEYFNFKNSTTYCSKHVIEFGKTEGCSKWQLNIIT